MSNTELFPVQTVVVTGNPALTHTVRLTGHTQTTESGKVYYEGTRTDNGLFEMIRGEWLCSCAALYLASPFHTKGCALDHSAGA